MRNPNGYGSVFKLSGKRRNPWAVRVTKGYDQETKKQVYTYVSYHASRTEALKALADYNNDPYDVDYGKMTFADVYSAWFEASFDEDTNVSTTKNYSAAYKHCSALYNKRMVDIRPTDMQSVVDNCPCEYQTRSRIVTLFGKMYKYLMEHDAIRRNYAESVQVGVPAPKTAKKPFTPAEIAKLWQLAETDRTAKIILIYIYCGVRPIELLDLKKENVHLDEQWFYIEKSKTDAGVRSVPIADAVLPFWRELMEESVCEYAITNANGKKLTYSNYKNIYFDKAMTAFGMHHTPHECRHTFATEMTSRHCDDRFLKVILGHTSLQTLTEKVYTHIDIKDLIKEVNKFEKILAA